ncbi:hypothetical protein BDM02DRAFT_3189480 [Thelephora ganbajun]|uniref:Uncharacterized protein n=1 Tax=Thelephora ganbajun TaxID=370292 RepID=A0ACB6Z8L4_THEGA|nr:hypothetical protein BDM02DRAFT_3189480 [Thelephora ganbajun]
MSTPNHDGNHPTIPVPPPLPEIQCVASVVWHWTKTTTDGVLVLRILDGTRTPVDRQEHRLPHELLQMAIAHLVYDTPSLKACAATCFAWYTVAAPHLHHTLSLKQWNTVTKREDLNPLVALHRFGLLPLVKRVQFRGGSYTNSWTIPEVFESEGLRYFSELVNVQELMIVDLEFSESTLGIEGYFAHLSPTLRSITVIGSSCPPRQFLDFLRLFPRLDDIKIAYYDYHGMIEVHNTPDTERAPIQEPVRGKLTLNGFVNYVLLREIVSLGGMRFVSMDLDNLAWGRLLLGACAETLETLRFRLEKSLYSLSVSHQNFDLSRNTVLRSLEVRAGLDPWVFTRALKELLLTITSPVFSEIVVVFSEEEVQWPPLGLAEALRGIYQVRAFRLAFCLETVEWVEAENLRALTSTTQADVANGFYDFLPCPPVVFSRTVAKLNRHVVEPLGGHGRFNLISNH